MSNEIFWGMANGTPRMEIKYEAQTRGHNRRASGLWWLGADFAAIAPSSGRREFKRFAVALYFIAALALMPGFKEYYCF